VLDRLFPRAIDNSYRGAKSALWLLGFLAAIRMAMGLNSIFNGASVLSGADGVPLASYPPAAVRTLLTVFAFWAWGLVLFSLIALLALVRYRAMTPLVFTLLLVEHLGRKVIIQVLPIARSGAAPASWINTTLLVVTVVGLLLSLRRSTDGARSG
jgi:hypothetical protein